MANAKLDFTYNAEINGKVQYFDVNGKMVIEYTLDELHLWMYKTGYNMSDSYLDANWIFLTTEYYNFKNPAEFKSNNTYSQTQSIL